MYEYEDEDSSEGLRDGLIKSKVDGPFGPTWVIVGPDSRLSDLKTVYDYKIDTFLSKTGKVEATLIDLWSDPEEGVEAYKLHLWISDREAEPALLMDKENVTELQKEASDSVERMPLSHTELYERRQLMLDRIADEERRGKRVTLYDYDEPINSFTKNSPKSTLEAVLEHCGDFTTEEQKSLISKWAKAAPELTLEQLLEQPIRLKTQDGSGFHVLTKDTDPDTLVALTCGRGLELGGGTASIVQKWIRDSSTADHERRIRIFHNGLDSPEKSTEIDLNKFSIDYVEKLIEHLSIEDAQLLPKHKARLDGYYDRLLEQRNDPQYKEPETLQVPVGIKGKTITVSRNMPSHVLETCYDAYSCNLTEENRRLLWQWHLDAPYEPQERDTVRAYQQLDFTNFKTLHKFKDFEEIEASLKSRDVYLTWNQAEKARGWVDSLEPIFPREPDQQVAVLMHSNGLTLDMNLVTVQKDPSKVIEVLGSSDWTTTSRNKLLIESWLSQAERNPSTEIMVEGRSFRREQPLQELKALADQLVETQFEQLTPEASKKLLTWIHTKEKFGDDYYMDKPPPPVAPVPPHRYDIIKEEQRKIELAMSGLLADLTESISINKEKGKDKDGPLPSL